MKYPSLNRVSSDAIKKATGKTWDEWVVILDKLGPGEIGKMI